MLEEGIKEEILQEGLKERLTEGLECWNLVGKVTNKRHCKRWKS